MSKKQLKTVIELQDKFSKELKSFSDQLHTATDDLKKLNTESSKGAGGTDKLTGSLLNLSNIVKTVGIAYLGKKIFELGSFAVNAASKMDELGNVTSQVFETSKKEIEDWAKTMDNQIGRSIYQLQNFASIYGSMFKGAGFDTSYFKNIAKDLSVFTADFSSFFNVTDDEAFTAIKGALTGETEALKRFGIILNDTVMAEYALTQGIKANWTELDVAMKMQLRYNKLMEMTTFIQGDASRTVDGYANSLKKAEGLIDNIATSIGQRMIPGATKAVHMFNSIAESIDNMLNKKDTTDYIFDFVTEKQSIDELYDRYKELSELYLSGLGTPDSEKERLEIYEKLKSMYPELISSISNEAKAYLQVGDAIDVVISKLKQKILTQAKEDAVSRIISRAKKENDEIVKNNMNLSEKQARISANIGRDITNVIWDKDVRKISWETNKTKQRELVKKTLLGHGVSSKNITSELVEEAIKYSNAAARVQGQNEDASRRRDMKIAEGKSEMEQNIKILGQTLEAIEKSGHKTSTIVKSSNTSISKSNKVLNDIQNSVTKEKQSQDLSIEKNIKEITEIKENWEKGFFKDLKSKKEALKRLTSLGAKDIAKYTNEIGTLEKGSKRVEGRKANLSREERYTYDNFQKEVKNSQIFGDITGVKELDQLKSKLSTIQTYMKGAIEKGNKGLLENLQQDFKETTFSINKININKGLDDIQKQLDTLDIKFKTGDLDESGYHKEKSAVLTKILDQFAENFIELPENERRLLEEKILNWKEEKKISEEKSLEIKKELDAIKKTTEGLDMLSSGFNGISAGLSAMNINNSKTISGISGIFGSLETMSNGLKELGGISKLGSVAKFAGSWGSSLDTVGTIASGVGAAVGVVGAIGSFFSSKGKKKAAAIDNRNKENEADYKKQVQAMQQLTQALQQNSERLKTFADRMLTDVAKNPTIKMIGRGTSNFDMLYNSMVSGKHFNDISALEKGSKKYRSGFRKKRKDTYTKVDVGESELLRYLGFDKSELDAFTDSEMKQLDNVLNQVNHEALRRATGRNLTESNVEEWKKQVHEFVTQIKFLENEKSNLFKGATLESFAGVEYKSEKELIKEYTEQFKQMGLVGEQYNATIQDMAKNNQVLVTSMLDVRNSTIEAFASGNGGFLNSAKSYFEKIYKNASSVAYDVLFSDIDSYMSDMFETISNKLVDVKKNGELDFSGLFAGFDFEKLKLAEANEKQAKQSLDVIKRELLESGVDLSIINKILPQSDFNDRINDLKNALSSAMNAGLEEHKFSSFTKALGQSLYDSVKSSLVKAFSESALYQGMLEKFIRTEDIQGKMEKAGNLKEAFNIGETVMKNLGYELEAAGFGGFDAINNLAKPDTNLGNAYYTDKAANVEITFNNTYNGDIYGMDDFEGVNRRMWLKNMEEYRLRPNGSR